MSMYEQLVALIGVKKANRAMKIHNRLKELRWFYKLVEKTMKAKPKYINKQRSRIPYIKLNGDMYYVEI